MFSDCNNLKSVQNYSYEISVDEQQKDFYKNQNFDIAHYTDIKNEEIITSLIGDHNKTNIKYSAISPSL